MNTAGNPSILICVDEYAEGDIKGRIYEASVDGHCKFTGALSLVKTLEAILNSGDYPRSTMKVRSFGKEQQAGKATNGTGAKTARPESVWTHADGRCATFSMSIMFRQNASWQGTLRWVEHDRAEDFRSVLELLMLLDSALSSNDDKTEFQAEDHT